MSCAVDPANIRVCVFDVDGTLTDGRIGYGCGFDDAIKFFSPKDGLGLNLAHCAGLKLAVLTGRADQANLRRSRDLKVDAVVDGCQTKAEGLLEVCRRLQVTPKECLFMGDDWNDLPALRLAGLKAVPADAIPELKEMADWVAEHEGGRGAVRDIVERLLRSTGKYYPAVEKYTGCTL